MIPVPDAAFASHETWGRGRICYTHPLKDGRVYAYAAAVTPAGGRAPDDEKAESKAGPALFLRSFDGIADWRPPQQPYASGQTPAGKR
ncbi:hypothetical protein ACH4E5_24145 [Streptomyces afghaniensis]|uniref:hypothetical protein n=1 Tax=Streptomyces afghaniensis TaxID=66865 RepID=UPI0037B4BA7D